MDIAKEQFDSFLAFFQGFESLLYALLLLVGAIVLNKLLRHLFSKYLVESSTELRVDKTRYLFLKNALSLIIFSIAAGLIVYAVPALKNISLTLFASAGIFAAILGFASQQAFSNIVGGIFIVIFKPFRVGDWINVGERFDGVVEDITLRHVVINNFENKRIIIPNSIISSDTIINRNINDQKVCEFAEYPISFESNTEKAISIIREEALNHPNILDNRNQEERALNAPIVYVRMVKWEESGVLLRAYLWSKEPIEGVLMKYDLNKSIKARFMAEPDIEIPYPHRTVWMKNASKE